ncbi:GNAT family N-acetyltransferase [Halioxenophilus aromaticivorans]|uniref:N-acetyltransferase domain-containing protein n=1 Tax=Halioxenophilus aromaticivorans TaxID=1306992 RepID=A0AAV3TX19_9ALTE
MLSITYPTLAEVDQTQLLAILNAQSTRSHLVAHNPFNPHSLQQWVTDKQALDDQPGYKVRAVVVDDELAGWCGLQPDEQSVEAAIVVAKHYWGLGPRVFADLLHWAKSFGHKEVVIHLLHSRRVYRHLERRAIRMATSERLGQRFTSYVFAVE